MVDCFLTWLTDFDSTSRLTYMTSVNYKTLSDFELADLEAVRLVLRGGSVIDWHRLNFSSDNAIQEYIHAHELDLSDPWDQVRFDCVKRTAIQYLRRNFEFPIPKPVEQSSLPELLQLASSKGHRQLCACSILKVMHIIHHLEARELLFVLPASSQELFHLVEQKIYRVVGMMMTAGLPVLEFIGGRKNKDSLYTKLLSKQETIAAQIYDKLRFRIVTRSTRDIFLIIHALCRDLFPFSYVIPGESTNTLLNFRDLGNQHPTLQALIPHLQLNLDLEQSAASVSNDFTANTYRTVHFVVDMPVRLSEEFWRRVPTAARELGRIIFVQVEFQMVDSETEQRNEEGEASHDAYKKRQKAAVSRRLKLGMQ